MSGPRHHLEVDLGPNGLAPLKAIEERLSLSPSESVRTAIRVYDLLMREISEGAEVVLTRGGVSYTVRFL